MVAAREDLLSTLTPIPTFEDAEQRTENNIIRYNDDGTISITPIDEDSPSSVSHDPETPDEWNENLADALSATERMNIADDLIELYEVDCEVRKVHFERLRDGLELLGLTDIPGSNVPFEGAAQVNHPMIAEALVQFNARAIEEYFPPTGPVKAHIVGEATDEKRAQGERLADYLNYQLTEQDEDYYENTDQMLFYLPMSGSAFKKVYIDPITGMTTSRFVTAEDFIVPYHAKSLRSASRYCHRYEMHANDVYRAQAKGAFLEDARLLPTPSVAPDRGVGINMASADSMEDLADDREHIEHEDDTIYTFLEYHIDLAMP